MDCNNAMFTHEMPTNHSARRRGRFIVPVSLHYQIHIFISPNMHFRFIIHEYSHYQICVSIPRFVGVYVYAGTINRPLQLLTVCQNAANNMPITQHSPTKCPRNTPPGVGVDSSRPYPCIIKYTYSFHQICISVSSYTNIHIIKYAFPFLVLWVFTYMRAR